MRHVLAQVFQHGIKLGIESRTCCLVGLIVFIVFELGVFDNHERMGVLDEFLSSGSDFQKTVVLDILLQETRYERLTNDRIPNLRIFVFTRSELFEQMMLMGSNVIGGTTFHEVDEIILSEILLDGQHSLQDDEQSILGLALLFGAHTVVAVVAVVLLILLTEIMEQHLAPTDGRLRIGGRFLEKLTTNVLLSDRFALHELLEFLQILVSIESNAHALTAIASSTSRFLIVAFEAFGNVVVNDKANIRLVNAHSKSDGGDNDVDALHEEIVLRLRTRLRIKSGMISGGLYIIGLQDGSQLLHFLSREAIDDAALALVLLDELDDLLVDIGGLLPHFVIEIRTIERTLVLLCVHDAQALLDVGTNLVGGSGCKCDDRSIANLVDSGAYIAILRSEIMSPLRDAVGFINGIKRNLDLLEESYILLFVKRLGSHI